MLAHEGFKERGEEMDERLRRRRSTDVSCRRMLAARDALLQSLRIVQHALGIFERDFSGLRELHAALGADEERLAQLPFERFDLVADRRLSQVEALRSPREIQRFGHNSESA